MYTALWLEDDPSDIAPFVREIGDTLQMDMVFAKTTSEAQDIVSKQHIDLFLLDIEITGERMTGIEYARMLRASQEHFQTPIVFVSSYSHLARHLFSTVRNCQLLTKPYTEREFENAVGSALGLYDYVHKNSSMIPLLIPVKRERTVEIDTRTICYIEFLKDHAVCIQSHDHERITLHCQRNVRKLVLDQIEQHNLSHLVQIYRSVVVNINEIKSVKLDGREGYVYLFGDDVPKPLGARYRDNIRDFL